MTALIFRLSFHFVAAVVSVHLFFLSVSIQGANSNLLPVDDGPYLLTTFQRTLPSECEPRSVAICEKTMTMLSTCFVTEAVTGLQKMKINDTSSSEVPAIPFPLQISPALFKPQKLVHLPSAFLPSTAGSVRGGVADSSREKKDEGCQWLLGDNDNRILLVTTETTSSSSKEEGDISPPPPAITVLGNGTSGCPPRTSSSSGQGEGGANTSIGSNTMTGMVCTISFHPIEPYAIYADHKTHTIGKIEFPSFRTTTIVGKCKEHGMSEGRLYYPIAVLFITETQFIIGGVSNTIQLVTISNASPQNNNNNNTYNLEIIAGVHEDGGMLDGVGLAARVGIIMDFFKLPSPSRGNDQQHQLIIFSERGNHAIRTVLLPDVIVSTVLGLKIPRSPPSLKDGYGTEAGMNDPSYFYPFEELLFVGDQGNGLIRVITPSAVRWNASTYLSFGEEGAHPVSMVTCGSLLLMLADEGTLYSWDTNNHTRNEETIPSVIPLPSNSLTSANSIVRDKRKKSSQKCNFFIADDSAQIFLFELESTSLTVIIGNKDNRGCELFGKGRNAKLEQIAAFSYRPPPQATTPPTANSADEVSYILTDWGSHTLKHLKIVASSSTEEEQSVTTAIGQCDSRGFTDGIGTHAQVTEPYAVAFRSPYEFYFGDGFTSGTIRRSTFPEYNVTTVIGEGGKIGLVDGIGRTARIWGAGNFVFWTPNIVLFTDKRDDVVRKITLPHHVVVTIAGNGRSGIGSGGLFSAFTNPVGLYLLTEGRNNNSTDVGDEEGTEPSSFYSILVGDTDRIIRLTPPLSMNRTLLLSKRRGAKMTPSLSVSERSTTTTFTTRTHTHSVEEAIHTKKASPSKTISSLPLPAKSETQETSWIDDKSVSRSATLLDTDAPLPQPPVRTSRTVTTTLFPVIKKEETAVTSTTKVLGQVMDARTAQGIQGSGVGSAATTASFSGMTTSLSSGVRMNAVLGAVFCHFSDISDSPSWMEAIVIALGSSDLKFFAGATVFTSLLVVLLYGLLLGIEMLAPRMSRNSSSERPMVGNYVRGCARVVGVATAMATQAYIPTICGMSALLFMHGDRESWLDRSAAGIGVLVSSLCAGWLVYRIVFRFQAVTVTQPRRGDEQLSNAKKALLRLEFQNTMGESSLFVECYTLTFDACADSTLLYKRIYFLEELGASCATSIIAGLRPSQEGSCYYGASAMLLIAILHLLYLCLARPYRTRLDFFFAILFACNLVVIGILSLVTIGMEENEGSTSGDNSKTEIALSVLSAAVVLQSVSMIVQTIAQCGWMYVLHERRRFRAQAMESELLENKFKSRREEGDEDEDEEQNVRRRNNMDNTMNRTAAACSSAEVAMLTLPFIPPPTLTQHAYPPPPPPFSSTTDDAEHTSSHQRQQRKHRPVNNDSRNLDDPAAAAIPVAAASSMQRRNPLETEWNNLEKDKGGAG